MAPDGRGDIRIKRYRIMVGSMSWVGMAPIMEMAMIAMMCGPQRKVKTGRWKLMTPDGRGEGGIKRYRIMVGSMFWVGIIILTTTMMCGPRREVKTGCGKPMTPDGRRDFRIKRYRIMVGSMSWAGMMAATA